MQTDILADLNPTQKEAVLHFDSPLLIVAGAGSGKTRVITHKIAYLVKDKNFLPQTILGLTFTNKAADEMKIRIAMLTGIEARQFSISTFHSLGLRILHESGSVLGFDRSWEVMDDDDQKRMIDRIIRDILSHYSNELRETVRRKINSAKMNGLYPNNSHFLREKGFSDDDVRIFTLYYAQQKQSKKWDYEDLISLAVMLLQQFPDMRERYLRRFQYIVIDEFQDTNPNQYELVRLLKSPEAGITAVGDDDQAIYSWRGANVRFLLDFEHDFAGTRVIKLEQNYRSTPQILNFANRIIEKNLYRRAKSMWAKQPEGIPVYLYKTRSKEEEAAHMADLICQLREHFPELFPFAILYRINSQSLPFETEFARRGISFQILKGLRFFDRKEVKDSLSLLKLAYNPDDDLAFLRLIDCIPLGIGPKTQDQLSRIAAEQRISLFAALRDHFPDKYNAHPLFAKMSSLHAAGNFLYADILAELLRFSKYTQVLQEKQEDDRLLNIEELITFVRKWQDENPTESLPDFLNRVIIDPQDNKTDIKTPVYLLTIHNAKGLEFPSVCVAGVNNAYMPFFLRKDRLEIEEERRLFYVACTRAIRSLIVSTGSERTSIFINDISRSLYQSFSSVDEYLHDMQSLLFPQKSIPVAVARPTDTGIWVNHPIFGKGKVVEKISLDKYLIHFAASGNKMIDTAIVKIEFL